MVNKFYNIAVYILSGAIIPSQILLSNYSRKRLLFRSASKISWNVDVCIIFSVYIVFMNATV